MKANYLFIVIAAASLLCACNRDEKSLFEQSAAERAQYTLDNAEKVLVEQDAWEMLYFANRESRGFNVVVKFYKDGKVVASAQNSQTTRNQLVTDSTSTWVVRNDYGPIISFDTYNEVLHAWADPQLDGDGFLGDYEFLILDVTPERVLLKGKKHSAYVILRPMPKMEVADYFKACNGQLAKYFGNEGIMTLHQGDKEYYLHNGSSGIFTLTEVGQPVPEVDPVIYPLCPTLDGFVVCYAFNSTEYMDRGAVMEHLFTLEGDRFVGEQGSIIDGGDLYTLFMTYISNNKGWVSDVATSTGAFADAAAAFNTALKAQSKDSKAKLNSVAITYTGTELIGKYVLRVKYEYKKNGQGTKLNLAVDYVITVNHKDGKIVLSYVEPADELATKWYAQMPEMGKLINTVMGSFTLSAGNKLNPANNMHLQSASSTIVVSGGNTK